mgnify:CR=1 FL=1
MPDSTKTSYCSNNTNKLSPQEHMLSHRLFLSCSNNTNKLSPQELANSIRRTAVRSNNTNKLSPQEHVMLDIVAI